MPKIISKPIEIRVAKAYCKICSKHIYRNPERADTNGHLAYNGIVKAIRIGDVLCMGCQGRFEDSKK